MRLGRPLAGIDRLVLASCLATLAAVLFLSLSLVVLRPPRADTRGWLVVATWLGAAGVATLLALAAGATRPGSRLVRAATGVALIVACGAWMRAALGATHFEGYALLLAALVGCQGLLSLLSALRTGRAAA